MNIGNKTLISESIDVDTLEKNRMVFVGKLLEFEKNTNLYKFAFKVEKVIMRLEMKFSYDKCEIKQFYPDSVAEFSLINNDKGDYCLKLNNTHTLCFITETSLIKCDEKEIKLKYNLYDKNTNQIISMNEISIVGEMDIC